MSSKAKAVACDQALKTLLGNQKQLELTAEFFRRWDQAVRTLGGALSAKRVETALKKLGVNIINLTSCARKWMTGHGWEINFA